MQSLLTVAAGRSRNNRRAYTPDETLLTRGATKVLFEDVPELPCDEILVALQLAASAYPDLIKQLDFSCLVALGVMCEEELKKSIGEDGHLMYACDIVDQLDCPEAQSAPPPPPSAE